MAISLQASSNTTHLMAEVPISIPRRYCLVINKPPRLRGSDYKKMHKIDH